MLVEIVVPRASLCTVYEVGDLSCGLFYVEAADVFDSVDNMINGMIGKYKVMRNRRESTLRDMILGTAKVKIEIENIDSEIQKLENMKCGL